MCGTIDHGALSFGYGIESGADCWNVKTNRGVLPGASRVTSECSARIVARRVWHLAWTSIVSHRVWGVAQAPSSKPSTACTSWTHSFVPLALGFGKEHGGVDFQDSDLGENSRRKSGQFFFTSETGTIDVIEKVVWIESLVWKGLPLRTDRTSQ